MPDKIGRFELVSQLSQSPTATIYKALDTESQQTVALKVMDLSAVKDGAALLKTVLEEAEQAKSLSSHNIAVLYGVGEEDGKLLAAAEYVQGNSIATTLARNEGFSIWDLQDIARQVCHALDHAQGHKVVHQSLEPAKIMVQWDGQAKVAGFGMSAMSAHAMDLSDAVPPSAALRFSGTGARRALRSSLRALQLGRSALRNGDRAESLPGETAEQVRQAILESQPPLPVRLKPKVNPGLSDLIMKALAKSPDERHQSGHELVQDLEKCKSANTLAAAAAPGQKPKRRRLRQLRRRPPSAASSAGGEPGRACPDPESASRAEGDGVCRAGRRKIWLLC